MKTDGILIMFIMCQGLLDASVVDFDKRFVGVLFEPYTKFTDRDDYTMQDVEDMLEVVSSRFQLISTFGSGTREPNSSWENSQAAGWTAVAASNINKRSKSLKLILNFGAAGDASVIRQEVQNVLDASKSANKNFNGTVNGIIMTSHHTYSDDQLGFVHMLLSQYSSAAKEASLKLGLRTSNCDQMATASANSISLKVLQRLDFIICFALPNTNAENVTAEVTKTGENFIRTKRKLKTANEKIEMIGETGWPSFDSLQLSFTKDKMVQYWLEMGDWARSNEFRIDMFTAFDEPWKIEINKGPSETQFGWWKRIKNDTSGPDAFVEKIDYYEPGPSHGLEIGLGILGVLIFLAMITGMAYLYNRLIIVQNQLLSKADIDAFEKGVRTDQANDDGTECDALRLPYDKSYEIPRTKFQIDTNNLLGSGAFGKVYKGQLQDQNMDIALKMTEANSSANNLKSLLSEVKIMIHVGKHPNVVSIVGAYTAELRRGIIMIATEFCEGGSLEKHLRDYKIKLSPEHQAQEAGMRYVNVPTKYQEEKFFRNCLRWCYEIACGMDHIASKKVIHADLATRNVLLTSQGTTKITDFGLSRRLYEYTNYVKQNQEPLPWRWMALESLTNLTFSTKSDVWSYGVAVWEIFALGDVPFPGRGYTVDFTDELESGLRMKQPKLATPKIYELMLQCWHLNPDGRPTFSRLADSFEALRKELDRQTHTDC